MHRSWDNAAFGFTAILLVAAFFVILYGLSYLGLLTWPSLWPLGYVNSVEMAGLLMTIHLAIFGFSGFIFVFVSTQPTTPATERTNRRFLFLGIWMILASGSGAFAAFVHQVAPNADRHMVWISLILFLLNFVFLVFVALLALFRRPKVPTGSQATSQVASSTCFLSRFQFPRLGPVSVRPELCEASRSCIELAWRV